MNRDEITRKTSELSTPDTPAISLLKTVIQRKKKWHFSRAILPFRLAKRKSLSNAWEKSAGSPAERPLPLQRRNSIRIPKSHTTKPHKCTCTRPTTPQNAGKDVIQATESVVPPRATIVRYALKADGGTDAIPKRGYDHDSGYEPMQHRRLHARSRRSGHVQHAFHIGAGSRSAALHCGRTSVALLSATTKQNNQ